ncbi:MoaD/ThiS family protein [Herbaspirillum autotrophicum]|uniref:MoaD/ThiS family protein n=1 Tax=Herbaspirillum autotrophicum TaxID=180195 RepID=UPI0012EECDC2|nr:MoaD/ThiS family protein [Herbaspirillum autotrophicum]
MAHIELPSQLSSLVPAQTCFEITASNLKEVFEQIDEIAPMVRSQIFDSTGAIRQFVGLFLDEHQIHEIGHGMQPVRENSRVVIMMAVAGG